MLTWTVRATVQRIVDGDTFVAELDLGWGVWRREVEGAPSRVRVLGIDAPEKGRPGYEEASTALADIIPASSRVWVVSHRLDSFGRVLAQVLLEDGRDIAELMPMDWRVPR